MFFGGLARIDYIGSYSALNFRKFFGKVRFFSAFFIGKVRF